jgi:hypothetical protein
MSYLRLRGSSRLFAALAAVTGTFATAPLALGGTPSASASACGVSLGAIQVDWIQYFNNGPQEPHMWLQTVPAVPGQACTTTISVTGTISTVAGISATNIVGNGQAHTVPLTFVPGQPGPSIAWDLSDPCAGPAGSTFQFAASSPTAGSSAAGSLGVLGACTPNLTNTLSDPRSEYTDSPVGIAPTADNLGYTLANRDYDTVVFGDASPLVPPSLPNETQSYSPAVGIAWASASDVTSSWVAGADGAVYAHGSAPSLGSMAGTALEAPVIGIASTPDHGGYWLVATDGGVFAFGDAGFYGSVPGALKPGQSLNRPIVGIASTPDGKGYWLVAADGGVFAFGDALFWGSMGGVPLNKPIVGIAANNAGGYWLVAADGGIFSFKAAYEGSLGGVALNAPITGIAATDDGNGYWMVAQDGGVFAFGNAPFWGSASGQ